jgi:hypothetical protein
VILKKCQIPLKEEQTKDLESQARRTKTIRNDTFRQPSLGRKSLINHQPCKHPEQRGILFKKY